MKLNIKKARMWAFYWAMVGGGTFVMFFLVTSVWIGFSVRQKCELAKARYEGSCTEAMSQFLDDERNPIRERNDMIWALGQYGDSAALPVLEKYYTGNIPDREPWDKVISQYELKKAIKLAGGGFNITALIWRSGLIME